jgi:hypothetical protein
MWFFGLIGNFYVIARKVKSRFRVMQVRQKQGDTELEDGLKVEIKKRKKKKFF